jgi:creatinine amidohydrolase
MNVRLDLMSWPEVKETLSKTNVVVLPIGSTEEHGAHLPLNVDAACATYISENAARKVMSETDICVLVAPTIVYTDVTPHHKKFPGTIGIKLDTFMSMVEDIIEAFLDQGFKNIIAMSSHLENNSPLEVAIRKVKEKRPQANLFAVSSVFGIGFDAKSGLSEVGWAGVGHALEGETSYCLVMQPERVHLERTILGSRHLSLSTRYIGATGEDRSKGILFCSGVEESDEAGTAGDPRHASREKGEKSLNAMVSDLADIIVQVAKPDQK